MSDKPLVQQALAAELAGILLTIPTTQRALDFLHGFWYTITREWNGIDRLRMDKFYMLVRRFINAAFQLLLQLDWEEQAVEDVNAIVSDEGGPLASAPFLLIPALEIFD